jgi:hypothetical protein
MENGKWRMENGKWGKEGVGGRVGVLRNRGDAGYSFATGVGWGWFGVHFEMGEWRGLAKREGGTCL